MKFQKLLVKNIEKEIGEIDHLSLEFVCDKKNEGFTACYIWSGDSHIVANFTINKSEKMNYKNLMHELVDGLCRDYRRRGNEASESSS